MQAFTLALAALPADAPSQTFITRCQQYLDLPPEASWDGVFALTSKD
jgi:hypothetical protein